MSTTPIDTWIDQQNEKNKIAMRKRRLECSADELKRVADRLQDIAPGVAIDMYVTIGKLWTIHEGL